MLESSVTRFKGSIIEVAIERVRLPNGRVADLEIAHHPGGAAIVAVDAAGLICMLRQYRHAAQRWLWELPAGKIDHHEPPIETARRELMEEAGVEAFRWTSLGGVFSSPGVFTEVIHLYLARNLAPVPVAHAEHEVIRIDWLPFAQALRMAETGELNDAKSQAGLLMSRPHLQL